ncbi:hypothetical protein [Glycomyces sp. NPDC021274]|jgi:hypothetical protein|uniref:hypothetical protein n=1 Tax=Glycomyces sp. NPDC021274 TaxID=3155120 RepID=UPI0033F380F2
MGNTSMAAVSAAAVAAAALSGGAASASTPDWLTIATVETEHDSMLPVLCERDQTGPLVDTACATLLSADTAHEAETYGYPLPEAPWDHGGMPTVVNADMRDFAKWQVCGIAVAASAEAAECDNSIQGPRTPVGSDSGIALVNADATGAFHWSVCGVAVGATLESFDC